MSFDFQIILLLAGFVQLVILFAVLRLFRIDEKLEKIISLMESAE